jgi:predicted N-acetyltransferase YhbS
MNIATTLERNLTDAHAEEIRALQQAAFPQTEEFRTQRHWHTPIAADDCWVGARVEGRLIGSVCVMFRTVSTAIGDLRIGGIGNVCSHPDARGLGAAKACMRAAGAIIEATCDFGLLGCGDVVLAFYAGLGWSKIDNEVIWTDADGHRQAHDPNVMILPGTRPLAQWPDGTIDLNGPNW